MINHKRKCLFIHVPKVAGQSIESFFLDDQGLTWEQRAPLLLRPNSDPTLGPPRLAHLALVEYLTCGHISKELFDSYFKFAFVRNPWDRAVSLYHYITDGRYSFNEFTRRHLTNSESPLKYFTKPQSHYIFDPYNRVKVDFIGRFENLEADFACIKAKLGMEDMPLRHVNKSNTRAHSRQSRSYRDEYDLESREIISSLFKIDIEAFGYEF